MREMKITEMPYITDKIIGTFDFEFELKNGKEIIELIQNILDGKKVKDKYGEEIQLKTNQEKQSLITYIKSHPMYYYGYAISKMNSSEKKIFDSMLGVNG